MLERYKGPRYHRWWCVATSKTGAAVSWLYQIQKLAKAHYICLNIECKGKSWPRLETGFRFNDAVPPLTVAQDKAITTPRSRPSSARGSCNPQAEHLRASGGATLVV